MLIPVGHKIYNQSSEAANAKVTIKDDNIVFTSTGEILAEAKIILDKKLVDTHDVFFARFGHLQHDTPVTSTVTFGIDESVALWDLKRCLMTSSVSSL